MFKNLLLIAFAIAAHAAMAVDSSIPSFEKGDLVAFGGDSITSGDTYHKYILTYWTTRYPELGVRFRNKGIFSDFVHGCIRRLGADILKEKPNKVVIKLGMNDSGASYRKNLFGMSDPDEMVLQKRREAVAAYRENMEKLLALGFNIAAQAQYDLHQNRRSTLRLVEHDGSSGHEGAEH